jgi:hypothetical protein
MISISRDGRKGIPGSESSKQQQKLGGINVHG